MLKAFEFCIPTKASIVPNGPDWLHEIKYDRYLLFVERDSYRLRAKRKSGLIKPPAADGPPVGSASLRPVSGGNNLQPTS